MQRIVWVLIFAVIAQFSPSAQAAGDAAVRRVERGLRPLAILDDQHAPTWNLADRMLHHKVPGVSIAMIADGKLAWARAYGMAAPGRAADPQTLFQAASISKTVTALAALRLVDEGKLALDEDVNLRLRAWKVPENEFTTEQKVTLRRILAHSAGLSVSGFEGYAATETLPSIMDVLEGRKPANSEPVRVQAIPGTAWRYSGGGYVIAQQLLTEVANKPFADLVREKVFAPLGMVRSGFGQPLPARLGAMAAAGHNDQGIMVVGRSHRYPELAAAGLWSTPSELARVVSELQKGGKLLKPATQRTMLTKTLHDYGLGVGVDDKSGRPSFSHSGGNAGFNCFLFGYLDGEGVVIMTNGDNGWPLIEEIMRSISAEYHWPDFRQRQVIRLAPEVLQAHAGRYVFPSKAEMTITVDGGRLFAAYMKEAKVELLPETSTDFFTTHIEWPQTFRFTRPGELTLGKKTALRQAGMAPDETRE